MFTNGIYVLTTLHGLISLVILTVLELLLGIDNIIFISLVVAKLPEEKGLWARFTGLSFALIIRLALLFGLMQLIQLHTVLFTLSGNGLIVRKILLLLLIHHSNTVSEFTFTLKDLLFFIGGVYLFVSTFKEWMKQEKKSNIKEVKPEIGYGSAVLQIVLADFLLSFDSVFTAVGLVKDYSIMAVAIVAGMLFMVVFSGKVSAFINKYAIAKTIALRFIALVGAMLVFSALHWELPKIWVYSVFAIIEGVEVAWHKLRKRRNDN